MTFHCFFDRHTHTHIHTVFGRVCCVCGCVFFSDARSSVTKGLSFFLPCLVRFFLQAGHKIIKSILCTGFATIRRLAQQFLSQGSGFFFLFVGFFWPIRTVTHHRWTHFSFKCFSPSLQSIFHRSNNLLLRYRSHSRYLSHFQRIHLAWGKRFKLHSQTILLLRNKIKTFFFFLEREEKKKKPKECVVCGVV